MANTGYTHRAIFKLAADGSNYIVADTNFDAPKNYFIVSTSQPLGADMLNDFARFMAMCEEFYKKHQGLKVITVKKFDTEDDDLKNIDSDVEQPSIVKYKERKDK